MTQLTHGTVVAERTFDAAIARVFAAFADPVARAKWGAPTETAVLIYDECDFRVGGRDLFRCGAKSDPRYRGEVHYLAILPDQHIVSCETVDEDGVRLSTSLNTVELRSDAGRTHVKITVQVTAFGGSAMIDGTRTGHNAALANLATYLGDSA
jgi:uncharacterized protein YndB with AHSA1/START domain